MENSENEESTVQPSETLGLVKQRRSLVYAILLLGLTIGIIFGGLMWRKHSINGPVEAALAGESGVETSVHRRDLIGGWDIVFDVGTTTGEVSMVDMTRRLLKSAEALESYDFARVYLSSAGKEKFYLEGPYFKQLGEQREWQNPVFTIRTMPENVYNLDGTKAFGAWSGGLIGVLGGQMKDNTEFHERWWVNDALSNLRG